MENLKNSYTLEGQIINLFDSKIFPGKIVVENGIISDIIHLQTAPQRFISPGLIDSHVHVESSMLIPSAFARIAVIHGTVATVSDPHEIGNVLGIPGIQYMIDNGKKVPFKFYFGAPSCVPPTIYQTSGAAIQFQQLEKLMSNPEIKYMSQMMDYPGVINKDPKIIQKLAIAKKYNKPVDGHAPGLMGQDAVKYIQAGISTDHQCYMKQEALFKMKHGMKILIRQGSAARNFQALVDLLEDHSQNILFCSDDKHPDQLVKGHINLLVKRAIEKGHKPLKVLKSCILNAVNHYKLEVGLLRKGDPADMIVIDNLSDFNILQTYIDGILVAENGKSYIPHINAQVPNNFIITQKIKPQEFEILHTQKDVKVIETMDGELYTKILHVKPKVVDNKIVSDVQNDILKVSVICRYKIQKPCVGLISNFGLKSGAIASTIGHDSHNLIVLGVSDKDMALAINALIQTRGGIAVVDQDGNVDTLPLPVAGLMCNQDAYKVAENYQRINEKVKKLGGKLKAPFMTLAFMTLLVIPELKISDKCLFDGSLFKPTSLYAE